MVTIYWPNGMKMHDIEDWMFDCLSGQELLNRHYDETKSWSFITYPGSIRYTLGNPKDIKRILITNKIETNIGRIKKQWYKTYCEFYGYITMENYMTSLKSVQIAINSSKSEMMIYKAKSYNV